tara:strand:+ start:243 stop:1115 length:873 start_codon:yes stop_codon:yes gene_type:complete
MLDIHKVKMNWKQGLPGGLTWFIIGQPKSGKTTATSKWSNKGNAGVLIIDTDRGGQYVEGANIVPCISLKTPIRAKKTKEGKQLVRNGVPEYEAIPPEKRGYFHTIGEDKGKPKAVYSLDEIYKALKEEWSGMPYDTLVIDTVNMLNTWSEQRVCKELKIKTMGDAEFGKDWGRAKKEVLTYILKFQKLVWQTATTLILISHSKQTIMIDNKAQLTPELPRGLANNICGKSDIIGYTTGSNKDNKFEISFQAYDERSIGSRLRPLAQKKLPLDYKAILKEVNSYKESKDE